MRRKVSLARAFVNNPEILLMDEPFISLDQPTSESLYKVLVEHWQKNPTTIILITHNLKEAILLGDRILFFSKRPGTVVYDYKVKSMFLIRDYLVEKLDFDKTYLYIDVGGGSTEYSIVRRGYDKKSKSFNIGTVRLINNLVDDLVFDEIKEWLNENIENDSKLKVFATGGNINKIQDMTSTKSGKPVSYLSIKNLYNNLLEKDITDRMIKYNLNADRADVIIPALKIFISTMDWSNTNKLFVPKVGLVDGMILEIHSSINSIN